MIQRAEVQGSKAYLEKLLGQPVLSFSYPYGGRDDYTSETVAIVRASGFSCACTSMPGVVWRKTDLFQLPRVLVRDCGGAEFRRKLRKWFRE